MSKQTSPPFPLNAQKIIEPLGQTMENVDATYKATQPRPKITKAQKALSPAPYEDIREWDGLRKIVTDLHKSLTWSQDIFPNFISQTTSLASFAIGHSPDVLLGIDNGDIWAPNVEAAIQSACQALGQTLGKSVVSMEGREYTNKNKPTAETLAQYHDRARALLRQYCNDFTSDLSLDNIDLQHFAEWILAKKASWSRRTWQFYRSALSDFLRRIDRQDAVYAATLLQSEDEDYDFLVGNTAGQSHRIKYFSENDFDNVVSYCSNRFQKPSMHSLCDYLVANITVGLRPAEFTTSEIRCIPDGRAPNGRQVWLFVCNAKFTAGRANGPMRALDLSALPVHHIRSIWRTIEAARMQSDMTCYSDWLRTMNNVLHGLFRRKVTKEKYSAYSIRHQAVANWKSAYEDVVVSALCGHAMPTTAKQHYGSLKSAWSPGRVQEIMVRPSQADIQRLKDRLAMIPKSSRS